MSKEEWTAPEMKTMRQQNWGLVEWVVDTCRRYKVDHLQILTLGQGHGLEQELQRLHWDNPWTVGMEVERGDKIARAYRGQHFFSGRQVFAPQYENGTYPTWCEPLIRELVTFPMGNTDDVVDSIMGNLRHLRDMGILERREEFERTNEESLVYRPGQNRVVLPYPV
jgi:phage terminase large subunit-like protein